jgi:tetratricopeptide (TPR) repeat protein
MSNRLPFRISLALAAAVLAAFSPVLLCGFIELDDRAYVVDNPHVRAGLGRDSFVWAWTSFAAANWHPLTWLSHMLDCQLFGLNPRGHHFVNLLWHLANTVGLFWVLRRMTGEDWRPALVAALFGLHPLHVESVAWVAERKDVLSTFFAVLTLGAYAAYAERPGLGRYLGVAAAFALGLLAKPMLVTLPLVLLLLDYWPLRRTPLSPPPRDGAAPAFAAAGWGRLVLEKVPLLALSGVSCLLTIRAQQEALMPTERLTVGARWANAAASYAAYLRKTVWPADLAVFYEHPGGQLSPARVTIAVAVLIALSLVALALARRRPAVLVGWLWFLGTLVPVIGLVQVGSQAMADRYTYLPLIGVFLALAWAVPDLPASRPAARPAVVCGALLILAVCAVLTGRQALCWRSDQALWEHACQVADSPAVRRIWGNILYRRGRVDEAEAQYAQALRLNPEFAPAYLDLGESFLHQGEIDQALATFSRGVAINPGASSLHNGVGLARACRGQADEACRSFREACRLRPDIAEYHYNLATALARRGDRDAAEEEYREGRRLAPGWPEHARQLAVLLLTADNPKWRCPAEALFRAEQACQAAGTPSAEMLQTLAEARAAVAASP